MNYWCVMKKSYVFEAVLAILVIGLISLMYLAIVSTPHEANGWEMKANGSVDYMFVGSDDTLYAFSGNNIAALSKNGGLLWEYGVSPEWNILNTWNMPEYDVGENGYVSMSFSSYPIVSESNGSLYLFELFAVNDTDVKVASVSTQKSIGNDTVYSVPTVPYISKPAKIVKISSDGRVEWSYTFLTNLSSWDIGGLVSPNYYSMQKPVAISVHGNRVYVFHDYVEDVLDNSGKLLFSINNASAPAAIDDQGRIYIVHATKPTTEQFNQSMEGTFSNNSSMSYIDSAKITQDPTYMLTSSIVEAYSPDGSLLWSCDIGRNAIRPFMDEQVWPYYNTLPLFDNHGLYVTVDGGIVKIDMDGKVNWTTYVKDGGYMLFPLMPLDSSGNVYMAKIGQDPSQSYLTMISPEGQVSDRAWLYSEYDDITNNPGLVPVGGNEGIVYAYESLGYSMSYEPESEFNETLATKRFSPDTIIAYDVAGGKELWNFTIPAADVHVLTLNEHNEETALLWRQGFFPTAGLDSLPQSPQKESNVLVYSGRNVTYLNYYYSIFDSPLFSNQSRCIYASGIYALDNNGSLLWEKDVNGFVDKMAVGNTTIYYSLDNGRIGGSSANIAAGIAIAAVIYMFLRFFMLGTVARARSKLEENKNRRSLFQYIVDHPGVTAADMAKEIGMNMGTLRYHLLILSLNHKIVLHRDNGKFLRYFKNSGAYTDSEKVLLSTIRRKPLHKIVSALIEKQRLSGPELARELNISEKSIYRHIAELQEKDILEKIPGTDRNVVYSIKTERLDQIKKLMSNF